MIEHGGRRCPPAKVKITKKIAEDLRACRSAPSGKTVLARAGARPTSRSAPTATSTSPRCRVAPRTAAWALNGARLPDQPEHRRGHEGRRWPGQPDRSGHQPERARRTSPLFAGPALIMQQPFGGEPSVFAEVPFPGDVEIIDGYVYATETDLLTTERGTAVASCAGRSRAERRPQAGSGPGRPTGALRRPGRCADAPTGRGGELTLTTRCHPPNPPNPPTPAPPSSPSWRSTPTSWSSSAATSTPTPSSPGRRPGPPPLVADRLDRGRAGGHPACDSTGLVADLGRQRRRSSRCAPTSTRCRSTTSPGTRGPARTPGVAHACGHDVHTAGLVGAGARARRDPRPGPAPGPGAAASSSRPRRSCPAARST